MNGANGPVPEWAVETAPTRATGRVNRRPCAAFLLAFLPVLVGCAAGQGWGALGPRSEAEKKRAERERSTAENEPPRRRGTGAPVTKAEDAKVPDISPVETAAALRLEAQRSLFIARCDKTLKEMTELKMAVDLTVRELRRQTSSGPAAGKNPFMDFLRQELKNAQRFQDSLELLTENVKGMKAVSQVDDRMYHYNKELDRRIETLEMVKESIPDGLIAAARRKLAAGQQPAVQETAQVTKPPAAPEPRKPVKTYTMKDGRVLQVLSELASGDDLIVKTVKDGVLSIRKSDIEKEEKYSGP